MSVDLQHPCTSVCKCAVRSYRACAAGAALAAQSGNLVLYNCMNRQGIASGSFGQEKRNSFEKRVQSTITTHMSFII